MNKSDKTFVAGHRGMVGSAIVRRLKAEGFSNLLARDHSKLDLADESAVAKFLPRNDQPWSLSRPQGWRN
jgi:GDP-L-fucose synthase